MRQRPKVLLAWSSGKDSAWALHTLRAEGTYHVAGLLTTFNEAAGRVAMHGVRRDIVHAQAAAVGLPLWPVAIPPACVNEVYQERMREVLDQALRQDFFGVAFGDLFLEDVRAYREAMMAQSGLTPLFPLWRKRDATRALAEEMISAGLRGIVTCVDPKQLDPSFVGRTFDRAFVESLPGSIDPCGENGEFHTLCCQGPMFAAPIAVVRGNTLQRDGFWFTDVKLAKQEAAILRE